MQFIHESCLGYLPLHYKINKQHIPYTTHFSHTPSELWRTLWRVVCALLLMIRCVPSDRWDTAARTMTHQLITEFGQCVSMELYYHETLHLVWQQPTTNELLFLRSNNSTTSTCSLCQAWNKWPLAQLHREP